jgi:hypothetical protein
MAPTNFDESVVRNLFQSFAVLNRARTDPVLSPYEFSNLLNSIGIDITSEKQLELVCTMMFSNLLIL